MFNFEKIYFKDEILSLEKKKTCSKCNEIFLIVSNHDCLSSLIKSNKEIKAENENLYLQFDQIKNDILILEEKYKTKIDHLSQQFNFLLFSNSKSIKKYLHHKIQNKSKNIINIRTILHFFFYLSIFFNFSLMFFNLDLCFKNKNINKEKTLLINRNT